MEQMAFYGNKVKISNSYMLGGTKYDNNDNHHMIYYY